MHDLAIIGGGITGLFTAAEAAARGLDVVCLEAGDVPGEQSRGEGRIFRVAHGTPEWCALALQAAERWEAWERDAGEALLYRCGLAVTGEAAASRFDALRAVGAPAEMVGTGRVPHLRIPPGTPVLWDPAGASIRTGRVVRHLRRRLGDRVRAGTPVTGASREPEGWVLAVPAGEVRAREVVACAGVATPEVAALLGVRLSAEAAVHRTLRLTFAWNGTAGVPCVIDRPVEGLGSYSLPTGLGYSIGMTGAAVEPEGRDLDEPAFLDTAREACRRYRAERLVGAGPEVVEEVTCRYLHSDAMPDGDGWRIHDGDAARVLLAANAYKFAPLIATHLLRDHHRRMVQ